MYYVIWEIHATDNMPPDLQNTSMYSALWACIRSSNSIQLNLVTALHPGYELSVSCYKPIEPLDARKEQDKCPQINADEHG